jgi:DNA-binding XRE family transcriptional regulator
LTRSLRGAVARLYPNRSPGPLPGWIRGTTFDKPSPNALRRLRHAKGISQEDPAHEAGINRSYMSKLEKGASYSGLEILAKLATVLKVEPAELLGLPGEILQAGELDVRRGTRRLPSYSSCS